MSQLFINTSGIWHFLRSDVCLWSLRVRSEVPWIIVPSRFSMVKFLVLFFINVQQYLKFFINSVTNSLITFILLPRPVSSKEDPPLQTRFGSSYSSHRLSSRTTRLPFFTRFRGRETTRETGKGKEREWPDQKIENPSENELGDVRKNGSRRQKGRKKGDVKERNGNRWYIIFWFLTKLLKMWARIGFPALRYQIIKILIIFYLLIEYTIEKFFHSTYTW